MAKKKYTAEHIIGILRRIKVLLEQEQTVVHVVRHVGLVEQADYRWHKEYGGMKVGQA